jgi:cytochrome c-type biogenesis protein CcmH
MPNLRRLTQLAAVTLLAIVMLGANDPEARFNRVGHTMMCICSCGQILLECNHVGCPDSARMRGELQQQIDSTAANSKDSVILNWFASKYGATVLAAPIRGGFDNVAWITPMAIFFFGILGTAWIVRIWSRNRAVAAGIGSTPGAPGVDSGAWVSKATPEAQALREKIRKETEYQ